MVPHSLCDITAVLRLKTLQTSVLQDLVRAGASEPDGSIEMSLLLQASINSNCIGRFFSLLAAELPLSWVFFYRGPAGTTLPALVQSQWDDRI